MDVSDILEPLNEEQRQAVTVPPGAVLVLAGAGSGKTRVLVHRIAWLLRLKATSPYNILAVTFTNKAAAEMRGRIEQLLGISVGGMWVGTFHSLAHRLLRLHWRDAGLPQSFQIMDADDQIRLIRRVLKNMSLDEAEWPPRLVQGFINARKDEALRPQHLTGDDDVVQAQFIEIYAAYEALCKRNEVVDFAELLLRAHELLREHPELLSHYRQRFEHILVDEFQDTNTIQYAWLRLIAGKTGHIFAVGDDDQSIYGWRGAQMENIHSFNDHFPGSRLMRLQQNYRSTATILAAANALIANNYGRLGKELWTCGQQGEPIVLYRAFNELDEAHFIADRLAQWVEKGNARSEAAVLYRSNAQSRVIEEALIHQGIPYRVYGGLRFFERAEIKDALAYLRLVVNRNDDASFERIVNTPTRGIGARSVDSIRQTARQRSLSMWYAAQWTITSKALSARALNAISEFLSLIDRLANDTMALELGEQVDRVINQSGLIDHYLKEKGEKGQARKENLEELVTAARQFVHDESTELDKLPSFLTHAALEAGEAQGDRWEDCVQLMTLHSAKGLEFPLVFMSGLEEGLFPHARSIEDSKRLEEERRLCYVGITRAKQQLYVSYAESRRLHGQERYSAPSRFVKEIPREYLQEVRPQVKVSRRETARSEHTFKKAPAPRGLRLGQPVRHAKFGDGVVLNYEGEGHQARVQVNFEGLGTKWLMLELANLELRY